MKDSQVLLRRSVVLGAVVMCIVLITGEWSQGGSDPRVTRLTVAQMASIRGSSGIVGCKLVDAPDTCYHPEYSTKSKTDDCENCNSGQKDVFWNVKEMLVPQYADPGKACAVANGLSYWNFSYSICAPDNTNNKISNQTQQACKTKVTCSDSGIQQDKQCESNKKLFDKAPTETPQPNGIVKVTYYSARICTATPTVVDNYVFPCQCVTPK